MSKVKQYYFPDGYIENQPPSIDLIDFYDELPSVEVPDISVMKTSAVVIVKPTQKPAPKRVLIGKLLRPPDDDSLLD